jgi:hypothetical protein
MSTYAVKVLLGVKKVIGKTGEPCVVTRKVTTPDPSNPTKPTTVTTTYNVLGVVQPETKYDPALASVRTRTIFIPDLLSATQSGLPLNTVDAVAWVSKQGDTVAVAGMTYKLLVNEAPRINGRQVAAIHEAVAL